MAEDLTSDAVSSVVRNEFPSDSLTEPGTETVPPTGRQTDEGVDSYISVTCDEYQHDGDEHLSIQSGSAFENRETVHIIPGDFDTYAIAYTCKAHDTCIKENVEETKTKANTASSNHNENDIHLAGCGSVQNYTDTFNENPYPMLAENKVNPNPMYLQSNREASNASPGFTFKPSEPYQELKTVSNGRKQAMDSNPMCTHNTTPYPLHPKNDVNPDRVYTDPQSTIEPSNASPESAFMSSMPSHDIPCTLTSADTHQQDDANMCQDNLACDAALSDTQPELPSQDISSAASNDINDASSNPLSNINGVLNALNPNPIYVPNVQNIAACVTQKWRNDYRCGDGYTTGDGGTAECDPYSTWPCCSSGNWCGNTAGHCDCAGCVYYHNSESGDRKLENIITIGGNGKEPIVMAYGVAVSADNEIFVTVLSKIQVFSINGIYLRHFPTALPGENVFILAYDVAIGIEPGHLWVVGAILESGAREGHVQVVKYSRIGQAMKKFDVSCTKPFHPPVIAIDVANNKIIVGQGKTVKCMIQTALRICRDKMSNIFVADDENNRVDMFTSRGKFIRTFANIKDPSGIAMGPDGEMVVTSAEMESTVTIFPRHMVLP
ncbi:hypothetical protein Bbelb_073600 [Branchiostoma belcheri]|nr:hypothetical protein Bbelb_073600 [Branchiostoma belcheri]